MEESKKYVKGIRGNEGKVLSVGDSAEYKTNARDMIDIRGERSAQTQSRLGRTPGDIRGVKRGDKDENIFASTEGRGGKVETTISGGDLDLSERRKVYQ